MRWSPSVRSRLRWRVISVTRRQAKSSVRSVRSDAKAACSSFSRSSNVSSPSSSICEMLTRHPASTYSLRSVPITAAGGNSRRIDPASKNPRVNSSISRPAISASHGSRRRSVSVVVGDESLRVSEINPAIRQTAVSRLGRRSLTRKNWATIVEVDPTGSLMNRSGSRETRFPLSR